MSDWAGLAWLFVLLAINAFFVGAEFAVISARRTQIEPLADRGSKRAKTALYAMEHATLMLATSQLGITVCSLLILNVSEPAIHHLLAVPLGAIGLPEGAVDGVAFAIALIIVSFLHVVFGEMVPKNLAFSVPDKAVLLLATPLVWVSNVFRPVIWSMNAVANGILRLFGVEPKDEAASAFTLEEVATIVAQSKSEGVLHDAAGAVSAVVEFTEKTAKDIAVPLEDLVTLPQTATPADIEHAVSKNGFSRYVIVDDEGDPTGYVHLKDVLRSVEGQDAETMAQEPIQPRRVHRMIQLSESTELEDALATMRAKGRHLGQVRNAEGATTAVLFLEDIIEELIGEIDDATQGRRGRR